MTNPFADLPGYVDIRHTIRKHPTKRYGRAPIAARTEIAIHHSLTTDGSAESFANYHIDTHGWPGCAYAFVIKKDGTIQHANDITDITYHVGNSNGFAVGVCLVGDFRTEQPTAAQAEALRLLHARLVEQMPAYKRTRGHNEYPGYAWKECPCFDYKAIIEGATPLTDFKDVKAGAWYEGAVKAAADAGIMSGYPDGTFKPNAPVTRAEMAAIVAKLLKREDA